MKNFVYKVVTFFSLFSLIVASVPNAEAAYRGGRTGFVTRNVDRMAPTPTVTIPQNTSKVIVPEEKINTILAQYNLSTSHIQETITKFVTNFHTATSDGIDESDFAVLIAALKTYLNNMNPDEAIENLVNAIQVAAAGNSMEEDQDTREMVRAMLLAADRTMQTYSQLLIKTVPTSQISAVDQVIVQTILPLIHTEYGASWDRVAAIDPVDPASAQQLKVEITRMYYHPLKMAYFQTTARPVFGATTTLMVLPALNYILVGEQMVATNIDTKLSAIATTTGYADPAYAYVEGAKYLIGTRNVNGMASSHLSNADTASHNVINNAGTDSPVLFSAYGANDMYAGAQMLESALHMNIQVSVSFGR